MSRTHRAYPVKLAGWKRAGRDSSGKKMPILDTGINEEIWGTGKKKLRTLEHRSNRRTAAIPDVDTATN